MTIRRDEEWIQIAELNDANEIRFTPAFRDLMGDLDWEAKAFVGHLLGIWYDPFEHMLDYSSEESKVTEDQPGSFGQNSLEEAQDVVEYWAPRDTCPGTRSHRQERSAPRNGIRTLPRPRERQQKAGIARAKRCPADRSCTWAQRGQKPASGHPWRLELGTHLAPGRSASTGDRRKS
ncbi:MAG: hypothetical protein HY608_01255 [Planctomycetes bacterium]|nr:hypothetical protein [Planctomycetota bacterium]